MLGWVKKKNSLNLELEFLLRIFLGNQKKDFPKME